MGGLRKHGTIVGPGGWEVQSYDLEAGGKPLDEKKQVFATAQSEAHGGDRVLPGTAIVDTKKGVGGVQLENEKVQREEVGYVLTNVRRKKQQEEGGEWRRAHRR